MDYLDALDRTATLFINGIHAPWADGFIFNYSRMWVWAPFYLLYLGFLGRQSGRRNWWWLGAVVVAILISDQISSGLLKPMVERLRPSHNPELAELIHTVNGYRGGRFGFTSSHASNAVAAATLLIWILRTRWQITLLTLWALAMGYSRIYLGVHYLGDVLCGSLIGIFAGSTSYFLFKGKMNFRMKPKQSEEINRLSTALLLLLLLLFALF